MIYPYFFPSFQKFLKNFKATNKQDGYLNVSSIDDNY